MADAELVGKSFAGRFSEINQCVGSNECVYISHSKIGGHGCTVNPANGREEKWGLGTLTPADPVKNVVVVGAGAAGLKVARTAALRGHTVIVLEREAVPGGILNLRASMPGHRQWGALTEQLVAQCEVAGVEVRYGVDATAASVLALAPDAVVIATGSTWDRAGALAANPGRPGVIGALTSEKVLTIDEAMRRHSERPGSLGRRIVILDSTGDYFPLGAAEAFTDGDLGDTEVTIVSPRYFIGEIPKETWELGPWHQRTGTRKITQVPYSVVTGIDGATVTYRDYQDTVTSHITDVDTLVICGLRHAERSLYDELKAETPDIHIIGDADAPRRPADAIFDGERVGRLL
jgi:hypothetical protein